MVGFDTVQDKALDGLLDSHGYTGAAITRLADGSLSVQAERRAGAANTRWRLTATIRRNGEVADVRERDW